MQTSEEVTAAIKEAIKDIPYPVNEVVTLNHNFGKLDSEDAVTGNNKTDPTSFSGYSAEYYLPDIEYRKAKQYKIAVDISGAPILVFVGEDLNFYRGGIFLPKGGIYIVYNSSGKFWFSSGGEELFDVYCKSIMNKTSSASKTATYYIARIA